MIALSRRARIRAVLMLAIACLALLPAGRANAVPTPPSTVGRIVFVRYNSDGSDSEVWTMNADGSNQRRLTSGAGDPNWSRDGSRLLFTRSPNIPGSSSAVVRDLTTNRERVLTTQDWDSWGYEWSPDNTKLLYRTGKPYDQYNGGRRLFIVNADGTGDHELSPHPDEVWDYDWSPDGSEIAFDRDCYVRPNLSIARADGSSERGVETPGVCAGSPSFSPDGKQLVFSGFKEMWLHPNRGELALFVINVDGTGMRQVTPFVDRSVFGTSFSPDGRSILFSQHAYESYDPDYTDTTRGLFRVNVDGTGLTQLTNGYDDSADWTATTGPNTSPTVVSRGAIVSSRTLLVDASGSTDPDGTIVSYEWRWGDGSAFGTTRRAWHVYAKAGWYYVRLTVTDNLGAAVTRAAWVQIA